MRLMVRALLAGFAVAALAACGSEPSVSGSANSDATDNDVVARMINGDGTFSLNAATKQKPVAFWFWAPG